MTVKEKLRALEEIWADLRRQPDDIPSPDWRLDVLKAREKTRKDGSSVYDDWAVAKERIRKRTIYCVYTRCSIAARIRGEFRNVCNRSLRE